MSTSNSSENFPQRTCIPTTEDEWNTLTLVLYSYVKRAIYSFNVFSWQGSEHSLAEDVTMETIARAIAYAKEAKRELHPPIDSFEAFCKSTAKRYLLDLQRKDWRLAISLDATIFTNVQFEVATDTDPAEAVIEEMAQYDIFLSMARLIKAFSPKMQEAILIHLARKTDFNDEFLCPIERAMASVDIQLRSYNRALPRDPVMRSRHNAQVCLALKRLRTDHNAAAA